MNLGEVSLDLKWMVYPIDCFCIYHDWHEQCERPDGRVGWLGWLKGTICADIAGGGGMRGGRSEW